jgi:hypothetical protein
MLSLYPHVGSKHVITGFKYHPYGLYRPNVCRIIQVLKCESLYPMSQSE